MSHSRKRRGDEPREMRRVVDRSPEPRHRHHHNDTEHSQQEGSNTVRFLCLFFTLALVILVLLALAVASNSEDAFVTDTATFRPQDFQRTLSLSSTGAFQLTSTGSNLTAAPPVTAGEQTASPDPACLVSNVEIGFAQCSNRITSGFSTDSLFSPNATYNLGRCVVPYMHTNLRQFVAVRTPSLMAGQFWQLTASSNASQVLAQYTRENSEVQYISNNATNTAYRVTTQLTDSNPAYYYRTKARECASVITFVLDFESCVCSPGAMNGTTSLLNEFCDCSGFSAPIVLDPLQGVNATFNGSSSSTGGAPQIAVASTTMSSLSSSSEPSSGSSTGSAAEPSSVSISESSSGAPSSSGQLGSSESSGISSTGADSISDSSSAFSSDSLSDSSSPLSSTADSSTGA